MQNRKISILESTWLSQELQVQYVNAYVTLVVIEYDLNILQFL